MRGRRLIAREGPLLIANVMFVSNLDYDRALRRGGGKRDFRANLDTIESVRDITCVEGNPWYPPRCCWNGYRYLSILSFYWHLMKTTTIDCSVEHLFGCGFVDRNELFAIIL